MNKQIVLTAAVLVALSANVFAQNIDLTTDAAKKQSNKLESIMTAEKAKQETAASKYVVGNFMQNPSNSFKTVYYVEKDLNIAFFLSDDTIQYRLLKSDKFDAFEVDMTEPVYTNGYSADPHAAVEIYAVVTLVKNNKKIFTSKPLFVTDGEALTFRAASAYEPVDNGSGLCTKCNDPYHCNCAAKEAAEQAAKEAAQKPEAIEAAKQAAAKAAAESKIPTKVVTEWEKDHAKDCNDPYHCTCPTKEVKRVVNKEKVYVKQHKADCVDKYHCDCPETVEYR